MTIKSSFFNSVNGDRKYDANSFANYFASFIGNGVFPAPSTNLQIIAGTNMTTVVKAGKGWINGYFVVNDSDYVLQHSTADGVLKRIDRVVMRLNYLTRQIEIVVKKGTSASNPVAPTLQRDTDAYELALADVLINNGATTITQANITDTRLNNSLCGIVHGTVDQVDTTTLFNQYQSWFEQFSVDKQAEFEQWIADLNDLLDGDVAANLLAQITQANTNLTQLQNQYSTHVSSDATTTGKGHVQIGTNINVNNGVISVKDGTIAQKGIVQLNNTVTSTSTTQAATANAVKQAYDRAELAFQTGNNVKSNTVGALLRVDDSLPITTNSAWPDIINSIGNISSGLKYAEGSFINANNSYTKTITGLSFRPKIFIIYTKQNANQYLEFIFYTDVYQSDLRADFQIRGYRFWNPGGSNGSMILAQGSDATNYRITDDGFVTSISVPNVEHLWIAIGG